MYNAETFGKKIVEYRNELGLSRRKLSFMSDVDYSNLALIESGKGNPSLKTVISILNVFNTDLSGFMGCSSYEQKKFYIDKILHEISTFEDDDLELIFQMCKCLNNHE